MADKNKLEIQEKDINVPVDLKTDLKNFKTDIEKEINVAKQKSTIEEAQKLLNERVVFDNGDYAFQVWDLIYKFPQEEFPKMLAEVKADLATAELDMRRQQQEVINNAKIDTNKVKENVNETLIATLQQIVDDQKDLKKKFEEFTAKNAPDGSNEDVAKMFELTNKLQWAIVSKDALLTSVVTAASVEALKEQNDYLRKIVAWYEKEWAKFDIKKFKEKNQKHISKDLQNFAKQFDIDLGGTVAADKNGSDNTDKTPKQKTYEEMSEAERIAKVQEAMQTLATVQMVSERDPVTGQQINVVNMSTTQISAVQTIQQFGGPDAAYDAVGYEPTRADRRDDRMVERTQKLMNKGKYKRALKSAEKTNERFTEQRKTLQKINAFSQNFANERNRAAYNKNVANNAMNLAKGTWYAGVTMDVIPYAPLFTNICQNINAISDRGHITMDVIGIGPVQIRSPERYNLAFNNAFDWAAAQYGLNGQYALWGNGNERGVNWVEKQLTKYTGLNTQQSKSLTNWLLLGGWAFLLFKSAKWLFTGKWKSDKSFKDQLKDSFWLRAATIGWWLWLGNKVFQAWTWYGMVDALKWLYNWKMEFKDLWKWTYAKYGKNSPEYLSGVNETYNQAFRNVPYWMILPYVKEGKNWSVEVTDIDGMINQLKLIASQTTDPNKKAAMLSQVTFLESVRNDPNGKNILNQAFTNMWLTYKKMNDNKDDTADKLSSEINERIKKYKEYIDSKWRILKSDKSAQDKFLAYTQTGKPTIEDMVKDWCFEKITTVNGQDRWDPFVSLDKDGKETPVDPKLVLDEALWKIDLPLAKQLHFAKQSLVASGVDAHFRLDRNPKTNTGTKVMLLDSYKMLTPIHYDNGGWYIGWPASGNSVDRLPIRFENAEHAIRVANLTNRLIALYTWSEPKINKPFSAAGANKDLMVGGSPEFLQRFTDTNALDSSTAKTKGGELFANQIQWYANYLNGIHNKNGESIWNKKGKVWYELRASYFENWLKGVKPLPALKPEDEYIDPNKPVDNKDKAKDETKNPDGTDKVKIPDETKNPDGTDKVKTPDVVPPVVVPPVENKDKVKDETKTPDGTDKVKKTPEEIEQDVINELVDQKNVAKLAEIFKKRSKWKDWGTNENSNDTYDMPDWFYKAWAINYVIYGENGAGKETFTYKYEHKTKGHRALTYQRQIWKKAPLRIVDKEGTR